MGKRKPKFKVGDWIKTTTGPRGDIEAEGVVEQVLPFEGVNGEPLYILRLRSMEMFDASRSESDLKPKT